MSDHFMIPGSHERLSGPECHCGAGWDRWNSICTTGAKEAPPPMYIEVQVGSQFYAECDCGWSMNTRDDVQLEAGVQQHTDDTGHIWPTGPTE
ncbi:hypothetical protein QUICO_100 [Mycobacterium phage Quico]|uniref:Uncharacterized protein n=1 Tax=Mycobacterium phage Florinda TaxID=1675549 RepID=A0A0K1LSC8_9CAUD|nr:hypothetical protein QUICO_100 [Mycobacterium phage Quico]YP_009206821.1 hypothetical protein FLORINDA_103 [Mycobacterium phage Florinda]AKU45073.1 hypothetical protein FLORINDA_103 [Mycobacterium phage Florinda]AKU45187.1 hypothetical protein GIRAFALES_100 [Mycobacterium phage Girafales]AKU45683.1 hypothetical protein QUICO_100 [Mycobacterium phage Quico]